MTQKVTKRQQAVLDCIEACIREKGYGPTVREVCQSLGLSSPSTVHVHLKALEDKGFIKRDPLKSRSIALTYPIEEVPSPVTAFAAAYSKLVNVPLPAMEQSVVIMGSIVEFSGCRRIWSASRKKRLTVAPSSMMATTISPLLATGCSFTTT